MPDHDSSDIAVRGYSITSRGLITERHIQSEFWSPAGYDLEADGFAYVDEIDSLHLPPDLKSPTGTDKPTAAFGFDDALVAVILYLGAKAADWAIEKVCDGLWETKLRLPLEKMLRRRRSEGYAERPMVVCFGTWYDEDRVFIGARARLTTAGDEAGLAELIPLAQRRGLEWIEAHGVTKPVVVFPIEDGKLAAVPVLADSIPD